MSAHTNEAADPAVQAAVAAALPDALGVALPDAIREALDAAGIGRALISKTDVTDHLGISLSTLDKMMRRGEIGYTRVGAGVRFTWQHVTDYVRANSAPIKPTRRNRATA